MNLLAVRDALQTASQGRPVSLVAVSKLQSIDSIKEAYSLGQRDFGENYVQELVEKSAALKDSCPEIRWHFIGALQSNKIPQLIKAVAASFDNLKAIQTVDSLGKMEKLIRVVHEQPSITKPIDLFLQVNISGEESKHGLKTREEIIEIYGKYKQIDSPKCRLVGLMVIGEVEEAERDFSKMIQLRKEIQSDVPWEDCRISMGMSADFELAARMGSDLVRVGSAIFGERPKKIY